MDEWLPEAREDLTAELEYVYSEFGAQAAEKAYRKVVEGVDILRHFPHLGRHFCGMIYHGQEVRTLSLGHTSLLYCMHAENLLIIALWNNRRNEKTLEKTIDSR